MNRIAGDASVDQLTISQIRFWREQDGQRERVLKRQLEVIFRQYVEVRSAYLMLVDYGENTHRGVALCLDAGAGENDVLRQKIQTVFRSLFNDNEQMDILFLTSDLIRFLQSTTFAPFYRTGAAQTVQWRRAASSAAANDADLRWSATWCVVKAVHRLATHADAGRLFELRRQAITVLAPKVMSVAEAETWAATLTVEGMERKLRELEIWVAEVNGTVAGWGAIRGDRLEGLYSDPELAGRGVGTGLLGLLEVLLRARGIAAVMGEASANAEEFYRKRGYELVGPRTPDGAQPMRKRLS
jgi:GNAT superfamily N-acetyltransferase